MVATTVDALIVAGGRATRYDGVVKSLLEVDGRRILDRQLDVLRPAFAQVWISANEPQPFSDYDLPIVGDGAFAGQGPLAGVAAGLAATAAPWLFAVAGDMPYLSTPIVEHMIALTGSAPGAQLILPVIAGRPEPLHAMYHRDCLPVIRQRLAAGLRKAMDLAAAVAVVRIDESVLRQLDENLRFRVNLNSPRDLVEG